MSFASFSTSTTEEADPWLGLKVGVATYTLRELPIEEAIQGVKRVGLKPSQGGAALFPGLDFLSLGLQNFVDHATGLTIE